MKIAIATDTDRRQAARPLVLQAERAAGAGVDHAIPSCECPEYCLLDHNN